MRYRIFMKSLLSSIQSPDDLKKLTPDQLPQLAEEVRRFLIDSVSKTGGHLASNLGVVELTIALHYVFSSPDDRLLWDVGHQSYTHKILTGRKDRFDRLRKQDGLSGFPKQHESIHDAFLSGHSSNTVSAAFGIAEALKLSGSDHHAITVIGDGSFTGGMVYEALDNAGQSDANIIVILNHNNMSISKNVGSFAQYLSQVRSKRGYHRFKKLVHRTLAHIPVAGEPLERILTSSKSRLKQVIYHSTFFEELGFEYLGPINGHSFAELLPTLEAAKEYRGPLLIHVFTQKGHGYPFAEKNPGAYHAVAPFDPAVGLKSEMPSPSFSSAFGDALVELAKEDDRICAVTAAMKHATGLHPFSMEFPSRYFDVGIAEQHAVTFCAGLSAQGKLPVFAVYSSFLQRAYDQLIHDCAIEEQHVVFAIDRAGIVGEDGETHQGVFDPIFLSSIPGTTIYAPETYEEVALYLRRALYQTKGVVALRYPRGAEKPQTTLCAHSLEEDYCYQEAPNASCLVITYGRECDMVRKACKNHSNVSVMKLLRIHPLPEEVIQLVKTYRLVLFVEEGLKIGGIGEQLRSASYEAGFRGVFRVLAIPSEFVKQGSPDQILTRYHLDEAGISAALTSLLQEAADEGKN